jgi:hypothetical protein
MRIASLADVKARLKGLFLERRGFTMSFPRKRLNLLVLSLVLLPGRGVAEEAVQPSFTAIVDVHFAQWDRNHDGQLSPAEVDTLVCSPQVRGAEAAALAAIHVYLRGLKNPEPLSKSFLMQKLDQDRSGERRDSGPKAVRFAPDFGAFCRHIEKAPTAIFATRKAPSLAGFAQGHLGDCYFLAAIAGGLFSDPGAIRDMFTPRPDGSCDVNFSSGHQVRVPKLTDAEIALGSSAGAQGLWLNVAEKAFGEVKMQVRKARQPSRDRLDLDVIARGGYPSEAIEVLSGKRANLVILRNGKGASPPAAEDLPRLATELHELFNDGLPRKFIFCCSVASGRYGTYPPGIVTDHAYAILGYDPDRQLVAVMNPWGNHFEPTGASGLANGYATRNGSFVLPLGDFLQIFEAVYYQTSLPLGSLAVQP